MITQVTGSEKDRKGLLGKSNVRAEGVDADRLETEGAGAQNR